MTDRCGNGYAPIQHPDLCGCGHPPPPAGTWQTRETVPRHYAPDELGGTCPACGTQIPAALAGTTQHPACDPDLAPMLASAARAQRRKEPHR